jgi:hypothetical protein
MRTITLNMIDRTQYDENETGAAIETTKPCVVQVEAIRCFYPRKGGRAGTRITFTDGGGFVVADSFAVIAVMLGATVEPPPVAVAPPALALVPSAE